MRQIGSQNCVCVLAEIFENVICANWLFPPTNKPECQIVLVKSLFRAI